MYLSHFFADADDELIGCIRCRNAQPLDMPLKMAFQPIVDVDARLVFAYEALVRGAQGESAAQVIDAVKLFQGYLLARPGLESLPEPDWSYC